MCITHQSCNTDSMSSQMAVQHNMTTTELSPIELGNVEVDKELVGFREIMDEGEEFTRRRM